MLFGVVDTMEPGSDAWRRPVALIEDAIRAERPRRPLPAHVPLPASQLPGAAQLQNSSQFQHPPQYKGTRLS
jgi:hypothetical protein